MNVAKKIFVGSIILLLLTPVLVVAEVNYSTHSTTTGPHGPYSLGEVFVRQKAWFGNISLRGSKMWWVSPGNLTFEFNEINGKVMMNFTLTIHHRLVQGNIPILIRPRYTLVDHLWISNPDNPDYFDIFNETKCINPTDYDTYKINLTPDRQTKPLETNGKPVNLTFYLVMSVDAGPIKIPWPDGTIWRFGRIWSAKTIVVTQITIVPIQDPKL
jgi:hypothetical protein